jgi:outer membrane immunogenic protein
LRARGEGHEKILLAGFVLTTFAAGPAVAADLPTKAPVRTTAAIAPVGDWTGFYIGGHVGNGWGTKDWSNPEADPSGRGADHVNGTTAGGQIGLNWQTGYWVFGIEAQASWANIDGGHHYVPTDVFLFSKVDSLGTIAGRIGYAWDRSLFYVKGGAGWAHDKHWIHDGPTGDLLGAASQTRWGWVAGAGWEFALTRQWSAQIEYNYMDFGKERLTFSGGSLGVVPGDIDQQIHVVKGGINYRFGGSMAVR